MSTSCREQPLSRRKFLWILVGLSTLVWGTAAVLSRLFGGVFKRHGHILIRPGGPVIEVPQDLYQLVSRLEHQGYGPRCDSQAIKTVLNKALPSFLSRWDALSAQGMKAEAIVPKLVDDDFQKSTLWHLDGWCLGQSEFSLLALSHCAARGRLKIR